MYEIVKISEASEWKTALGKTEYFDVDGMQEVGGPSCTVCGGPLNLVANHQFRRPSTGSIIVVLKTRKGQTQG